MEQPRCGVCRFSSPEVSDEEAEQDLWDCRRKPPVLLVVGNEYISRWPLVYVTQWCGEFELDPNLANEPEYKHLANLPK